MVYQFDEYWIYHRAWSCNENSNKCPTSIICYWQGEAVGCLNFYRPGYEKENYFITTEAGKKYPFLCFEQSMLANILETLRNEKPLVLGYMEESHGGWIGTRLEPIGELEGA